MNSHFYSLFSKLRAIIYMYELRSHQWPNNSQRMLSNFFPLTAEKLSA